MQPWFFFSLNHDEAPLSLSSRAKKFSSVVLKARRETEGQNSEKVPFFLNELI